MVTSGDGIDLEDGRHAIGDSILFEAATITSDKDTTSGTGDGAGVLTEIPFELLRAELDELNIEHDTNKKIGIISCFFDPKNIDESKDLINIELNNSGIKLLYWRKVPTDKQILGDLARESKPSIYQGILSAENESHKNCQSNSDFSSRRAFRT